MNKFNYKKLGLAALGLAVVAGTGLGVWYWQQQEVKSLRLGNDELSQRVNELEKELRASSQQLANIQQSANPSQAACSPPQKITYTAQVGKFKLELPCEYSIVQEIDGGFEGGESTHISVGTYLTNQQEIPKIFPSSSVTVVAKPITSANPVSSVANYAQNQFGSGFSPTQLSDITVDGATAKVYDTGTIFSENQIFFKHNGVIYQLSGPPLATGGSPQSLLGVVVNNFSFN